MIAEDARDLLENHFAVLAAPPENPVFSASAADLPERGNMLALLDTYGPLIKALDRSAAAVYFANLFGNLASGLLVSLSLYGRSFDASLGNMTIHLFHAANHYRFGYQLADAGLLAIPNGAGREQDVLAALGRFFGQTVRPLYEACAAVGDLPISHAWGLLPSRMLYFVDHYADKAAQAGDAAGAARLRSDYAAIKRQLGLDVFGLTKHPFDIVIRTVEDLADPAKQMRMKNACCLYYRTEGGDYCYTCPRLKESVRAERRAAYRSKAEAAR